MGEEESRKMQGRKGNEMKESSLPLPEKLDYLQNQIDYIVGKPADYSGPPFLYHVERHRLEHEWLRMKFGHEIDRLRNPPPTLREILNTLLHEILCRFGMHDPEPYKLKWKINEVPTTQEFIWCRWCYKVIQE